jgi:hypothetical protein
MPINTVPITPDKLESCLDTLYSVKLPTFLHGAPGIGKSTIISNFAKSRGMELIIVMLSQIEATDLRGIPYPDREARTVSWFTPEFLPREDIRGIIFLDELSGAEPRLQVAAYQLILDRRVGEYKLPPDWWVVGAGNNPEDGAIAYEMGSALSDRLVHFKVVPNPKAWIQWALENEIHLDVITFIQVKPDYLDATNMGFVDPDCTIVPTPRSWERVSQVLKTNSPKELLEYLISGIVGQATCVEFFHILEELQDCPTIETLLQADRVKLLKIMPRTIPGLYGLAYSLVAYCQNLVDLKKAARIFNAMIKIQDELPRAEIQTLAFELLMEKADKLKLLLSFGKTPQYKAYQKRAKQITNFGN